jgi:PAS domain S-box-containing protein
MLLPPGREDELPAIMERIRRGEKVEHYETKRRRKDGTVIDVSLAVSPDQDP